MSRARLDFFFAPTWPGSYAYLFSNNESVWNAQRCTVTRGARSRHAAAGVARVTKAARAARLAGVTALQVRARCRSNRVGPDLKAHGLRTRRRGTRPARESGPTQGAPLAGRGRESRGCGSRGEKGPRSLGGGGRETGPRCRGRGMRIGEARTRQGVVIAGKVRGVGRAGHLYCLKSWSDFPESRC